MWPGSFVMNLAPHPVGSSSNVLGWTIRFAAVVSGFLANRLLFRKAKESDWRPWHFGIVKRVGLRGWPSTNSVIDALAGGISRAHPEPWCVLRHAERALAHRDSAIAGLDDS